MVENFSQGEVMSFEEFRAKLDEAQKRHDKEVAEGKSDFNVFEALGVECKENYHSAFLAYLLDTEESHYQTIFAEKFLKKLSVEKSLKNLLPKFKSEDIEFVETEYAIRENRRIDILMGLVNDFYILIENKVYAKDQDRQIRDYIEDLLKGNKEEERNKAQGLLTIYLSPYENNPSDRSFGLKSNARWGIDGNVIVDSRGEEKSLYFKMDYKWIQEWLKECLDELKAISKEKVDSQTKGDRGLNKIVFTLEQYLSVLEWIIPDCYIHEDNPILDLICDENYQRYAFEIHSNESDAQYEIIDDVWGDFEEHIVKDFFNQLEEYMDKNTVCLADQKENWFVIQTQRDNFNTVSQYRLRFFPNKYYDTNYWVGFNVFYSKPNYGCPSIDLRAHLADDDDSLDMDVGESYEEIRMAVKEGLESIVIRTNSSNFKKSEFTYWKMNFLDLKEGENLVSWIMQMKDKYAKSPKEERDKAIIEEFVEKIKIFTTDKHIIKTYKAMAKLMDQEHEGFEQ